MIVIAYLLAIVLANLLIGLLGPAGAIIVAFVFIGFDLTARDALHNTWQGNKLTLKMTALIAAGGILSYLLNRELQTIAIASTAAFALAAIADTITYQILNKCLQI